MRFVTLIFLSTTILRHIVRTKAYSAPQLPAGHRFPMGVFRRIYETLLADGLITQEQVHVPSELPCKDTLQLVHTAEYVDSFTGGLLDEARMKRIGFGEVSRSPVLIERTLSEVAGTLLTARLALEHGLACNTAGGTHHAFPSAGSGFCILNDLAITAAVLLREAAVERVLILDLDVHQGDGTALIFEGEPRVFTMSMHGEGNFPARKQRSDLDVPLPDGTADDEYLRVLGEMLPPVLSCFQPDIVLYDAGVDTQKDDSLGKLALTDDGLLRRELQVLDTCLAAGIPVAGYVGGGYSPDLDVLARRHTLLHKAAAEMWELYELGSKGTG
ncbi:Acetoin utilization protein AcuC [Coccomyxa sp. Obi]|nr:Acetoin utilization protein AcuC [Coccomyxa sp. Obi]